MLILGSLPGTVSLAAGEYYAHPRNLFWSLVGAVIARDDLPTLPYGDRTRVLLASGLGLWDVYASARRDGSLDSAIREAADADLQGLIAALPRLHAIAFNGAAAARAGRRLLSGCALALVDLPSSSPAHAAMPLATKRERWLRLKEFLDEPLNPPPAMDIGNP